MWLLFIRELVEFEPKLGLVRGKVRFYLFELSNR